ncbi:MAG TPA: S41 family peptidase [Gemmatimonadaceae bacterium]|nr:S41 family peptidase [Gemmatimonadaceae bacterium]
MSLPTLRILIAITTIASIPPVSITDDPAPRPSYSEPSFSPDRREIVFASGGDIWTVAASGGDARLLVSNPATERRPFFSPDGSKLAFVSTRTGNGDIYVLSLVSGDLQRITYDDGLDLLDGWSHDGRYLYFSSTSRDIAGMNDVYRVSAAGGTPMQVAGDRYVNEYWSSESPAGHTLAITARGNAAAQWWRRGHSHIDESEIWLVNNVDPGSSGDPKYSPVTTGGAKSEWPMWSSDGATLFFVSDRTGNQNLWSRAVSGGDAKQLTNFASGRVLWPAISKDGNAIVFERDFGIWVYDRASSSAKQIPIALRGAPAGNSIDHLTLNSGIREVALSPDAKKVAFLVHGEIFAASAKDGGDGARVSTSAGAEGQLRWAPDSRRLLYASDRDGVSHLFLYDFGSRTETQLTRGPGGDVTPRWSPDGKSIAYMHDAKELRIIDPVTKADRKVATAILDRAPFLTDRGTAWSPDGRWIAYLAPQGSKLYGNVFVVSADGGDVRPVSFTPTVFANSISWSPDGTFILANATQRTEPAQLIRIDLVPRTPRFREDQFRDLFPGEGPRQVSPSLRPVDSAQQKKPEPAAKTDSTKPAADTSAKKPGKRTEIVFNGIRQRSSSIPVGVDVNSQVLSPDGKYVLLTASAAGQQNLYVYPIDDLLRDERVAKQLTSTSGNKNGAQWSPDGKEIWYLENGRISIVNVDSRATRSLNVNAEMDVDFAKEKMVVFNEAWRYLADNFFDDRMNGVDWNAMHESYGALVAGTRTPDEMRRAMQLMVGELNASHSGVNGPAAQQPYTGRLGLRFDRAEYEKNGALKVMEITPLSAASLATRIKVGDYVTGVNGQKIDVHTNIDDLLSYTTGKQTTLSMRSASGAYEASVLPVNAVTDKRLLYRGWVEEQRAYVSKISGGKLGYVHMIDMGSASLDQLQADLDAENSSKAGVVIDVRNNNGGFVHPYALDVLTRRGFLTMQSRDQPITQARTQLGQRSLELPTILVTNMHSLSDAEDFTEGYRSMKLGKVVGEPTAGWIVFTSDVGLIDGSTVRLPSTRIRGADGKDMENNPRPVDIPVTRAVGEGYSGRDSQLDAAVQALLTQLGLSR